ncbi:acyl-CoA dehydrogenase family protein [Mycobacterium gordonae]|uniref:Acyl-CoA dehydrogenase n=2 Tax=Mycobacterium TaxID=1763 RepID=A0A1X1WZ77_MYCGO|nr:acyl-CoA dehydrogenase family protein [Mycobacterium gordonae]MCV7004739.1 acyl-CoA dehydrogenase [Mycobacterium gordonae]ODR20179.1 acyl-CoA dehydrogenase [Mycobacterium gordonae]ORV91849.1 acyl-CoA dehydrogenase [Mycobacterium gordonae]
MTAITDDFVDRLHQRAREAEQLRRLPEATVKELEQTGFTELLKPKGYGGQQAPFATIFDPVRRMAHGCASTAWTAAFYTLHTWMLSLFDEQAQAEGFASQPFLASAPLAPTGRGTPAEGGVTLSGRWSWATGVMDGNWAIVGALCGPDDAIYPALALVPADDVSVVDVWHTDGMCATGSNDIVAEQIFVPAHRLIKVTDIYAGTTPGARLHDADVYRWPLVPALALTAAMPALGAAERVAEIYTQRLSERVLAYEGTSQKDKPAAQARLGQARIRLRALHGLLHDTSGRIDDILGTGNRVPKAVRADARLAAAHIVKESRGVIADLLEASGASAHFLDNPLQRAKRDVDVISGHVIFDYDTSRELAGALAIGLKIPPTAMV